MSTSNNGEQPSYATTASVAGLAREVETLRRAVQELRGLPAQVEDLARVVTELAAQVHAKLRRAEPVCAPSWLDLPSDIETATVLLRDLVAWMGDVYLRYADAAQSLPACWLWHPDVVEELLWLMHAWRAAYRVEDATVAAAGDWHDRYRPGVVRRVKQIAGNCSLDNHQPRHDSGGPGGARPVVPVAEAMAPIAAWWANRRDDTPPEPSEEQLEQTVTRRSWAGGRR
jgi:hypothetical protein